jgi:hypothetical protein
MRQKVINPHQEVKKWQKLVIMGGICQNFGAIFTQNNHCGN